ncbi:MAG: hypothetical protein C5B54_03560 [Acidobacteria bacterium]|nr:MAG: hypothetical protein C5B54_03560 [Acidobacteriota bacterium]
MASGSPSIEKLQKKLEKEPNPVVFLQLAEEYRKEGLYQDALRTCQDGLRRHPNYWSTRVAMGRIYHEMGDVNKAREELEKVIKAVPDNLLANRLLGDIYFAANRQDDALKRYRLVQMLSPADQEVASNIQKLEAGLSGIAAAAPKPVAPPPPPPVIAVTPEPVPPPPAAVTAPVEIKPEPAPVEINAESAPEIPIPPMEFSVVEELPPPVPAPLDLDSTVPHIVKFEPPEAAAEEFGTPLVESLFLDSTYSNESVSNELSVPSGVQAEVRELPIAAEHVETRSERRPEDLTQPIPDELESPFESDADELTSQTLAELYVQQGHTDKAVKVFQKLLLNDPNNTEIIERLKELNPAEALLASAARDEKKISKAPLREEVPIPVIERRPAVDSSEERRRKITTLESWLSTIRRERE